MGVNAKRPRDIGRAAVALACVAAATLCAAGVSRLPGARPATAHGANQTTPRFRDGYRLALAPYTFTFPRDHASHPDYRTEWWYYTGQLESQGGAFGYQLTFFRVGVDTAWRSNPSPWAPHDIVFAHAALSDLGARRFRYDERIARPAFGMAGADTTRLHTWVADWSVQLAPDGRTHVLEARGIHDPVARGGVGRDTFAIALALLPSVPPVIHGRGGVSAKSGAPGNASHYYSLTRMATRGSVRRGGRTLAVTGTSWMDHEFGTSQLAPGVVGWDWVSLRLDDGRDLMLYRLRLEHGGLEPASSGTLVARDGSVRALTRGDFELEPDGEWRSARTGGRYPARWHVRIPGEALELTLVTRLPDQELVTRTTGGAAYWEGAITASGTTHGHPVSAEGYLEMTGYAGSRLAF